MSIGPAQQSVYSIRGIACIFAGIDLSQGFAEGDDVISYAADEDLYDAKVGADGTTVLYERNNNVIRPKIKLMQGSIANAALSSYTSLSRATPGGLPGAFSFTDPSTATNLFIPFALPVRIPDRKYGQAPNEIEWAFVGVEDALARFDGSAVTPII
jgi:hypothetical protein